MNSVERVKSICKERKIPIYRLERDLGYANGYIGQLKKGTLPDDRLIGIANYLNVPVSDLTGEGQKNNPPPEERGELSPAKLSFIEKLHLIDDEDVELLNGLLDSILARRARETP